MVGFWGTLSTLKGVKHAAHKRESHVGSDDQRAHEIIAEAGPDAAIALVRCKEAELGAVAARAADRGGQSWHGSVARFLAGLTPAARTTGFAPRSTSPPEGPAGRSARTAERVI
jgi:hypothetical protein